MGNYEQLKQAVSDVIKTNGNQEITGAILQNALLTIISTIGNNSTFAGIATPTTNPGTPDANVFWLAGETGTYSNFAGLKVEDEAAVFYNNNGTWRKFDTGIPSQGKIENTEAKITEVNDRVGNTDYVVCSVESIIADKAINIPDYELNTKTRILVKMDSENTANNATLKINIAGGTIPAKPLFYNGVRVSADNTWDAGAVLDIYFDGTNFQATDWAGAAGGGGNIILEWNTDVTTTRKQVKLAERKGLLQISYRNGDNKVINEQYVGTTFTDTEWVKDTNWQNMPSKQDVEEIVSKTIGSVEMDLEWKGGTSELKIFYNSNGKEDNVSNIPGATQFGISKIDIRRYVGYTLYINSQIYNTGYNLFIDENNSVIEKWQQSISQGTQEKVVPNNAVFMLLSNAFADAEGEPRNPNPFVSYIPNVVEIDKVIVTLSNDVKTLDNEVSKINNVLYTQEFSISWNGGVDKTTKKFYDSNGRLNDITNNNQAAYFGAAKVDVSNFEGIELEINSFTGTGIAYNLFVDESGSVLDSWQTTNKLATIVKKNVPIGAKSLLLSSIFYTKDLLESNIEPYVRTISFDYISSEIPKIIDSTEKVSGLLSQKVKLSDINTYVGDTLQLFKYAMFMLADYLAYNIDLSVDTTNTTDRKMGKNLERYFEFIGTKEGTFPIYVSVSDRNLNVLFEGRFNINVLSKTNPSTPKNILLIGDSETEGITNNSGILASENSPYPYSNEVKGLLGNRVSDDVTPAGINLTNVRLIGTKNTTNGRHEGYGGWTAHNFMAGNSPFWIGGKVDFNAYLAQDNVYDDVSYKGVDYIYILLGVNNTTNKTIVNGVITLSKDEYKTQIISFLRLIKEQLIEGDGIYKNSNLKVILLNYAYPYISGRGYHPYGSGKYEAGILTAKGFEECGNINDSIAQMEEFSSFVSSVRIASQVDSEFGFVYIEKQINSRSEETEKVSVEQVHFNSMAYKQYGQGVVRDLLGRL